MKNWKGSTYEVFFDRNNIFKFETEDKSNKILEARDRYKAFGIKFFYSGNASAFFTFSDLDRHQNRKSDLKPDRHQNDADL